MKHPLSRRLIVEALGTFLLMLCVGLAIAPSTGAGPLAPLAIGSALIALVFAGGHVSGAHYNPAVSIGVLLRGHLGGREAAGYVAVQMIAGLLGGLAAGTIAGEHPPTLEVDVGRLMVAELIFTCTLVWVVLNVATSTGTAGNSFFGLAIGLTVAAAAWSVGEISGAALNPAIALGACVLQALAWSDLWAYVVAQIAGGVVGAALWAVTQPHPKPPGDVKSAPAE